MWRRKCLLEEVRECDERNEGMGRFGSAVLALMIARNASGICELQ